MARKTHKQVKRISCRLRRLLSNIIKDMNKKILLLTMFFLTAFLYSQEMKLYAPFPSRINAETSGTNVLISWKDAKDVIDGNYEIYRSETAITADNLYLAEKVGDAPAESQLYSDIPPVGVDLYYAVFAKDSTQTFKICIPYRNVTTSAIRIDESDVEETKSSHISGLSAISTETDVQVSFLSSLQDRGIIIFRSTSPIDSYEILLKSVNIAEVEGSDISYTDSPMAGIAYYYAAIDSELYRSGSKNLLYEGNFTTEKVQVKFTHEVQKESEYVKSSMPLPLLKVTADLESGTLFKERKDPESTGTISDENLLSIKRLIGPSAYPSYDVRAIEILGYNKNINSLISKYFINRKWEETADQLEHYTSLNFDRETRTQSHFYRGQSYFFLGQYNKAMLEFIMIEKELFIETEPWFRAIYRNLKS